MAQAHRTLQTATQECQDEGQSWDSDELQVLHLYITPTRPQPYCIAVQKEGTPKLPTGRSTNNAVQHTTHENKKYS